MLGAAREKVTVTDRKARQPDLVRLTWPQALAWRLKQHLLEPIGTESVANVVGRLGAIPAGGDAELAVRLRRRQSRPGEVDRALAEGRIVKVFAFRGATHLMTPDDAAAYLALRAASRMWELPSWQSFYGVEPRDWELIRSTVRDALAHGPLTRDELSAAITAKPRFQHLGFAFADNAGTFLKPLCWQGVMSFGPPRDGRSTFRALDANPRWNGLLELDVAGVRAVESYFRSYGPATPAHLHYWLAEGLGAGRKRVQAWIADLGDRLAEVEVDGERALILREDLQELASMRRSDAIRLLPGYDQWVLGPGTADVHVVPPARRALVSRQAAIVIVGGVVSGTWSLSDDAVAISWFAEPERSNEDALGAEVARLSAILGRPLSMTLASQA
jgi:hypothetical protein